MLKKKFRLPISQKKSSLKTIATDLFLIKINKNSLSNSRFGFSVSKSIDKRAVVRNRLKRQLRSLIEENLGRIDVGYDFLFILSKNIKEERKEKLYNVFENTLKKEKLLK